MIFITREITVLSSIHKREESYYTVETSDFRCMVNNRTKLPQHAQKNDMYNSGMIIFVEYFRMFLGACAKKRHSTVLLKQVSA